MQCLVSPTAASCGIRKHSILYARRLIYYGYSDRKGTILSFGEVNTKCFSNWARRIPTYPQQQQIRSAATKVKGSDAVVGTSVASNNAKSAGSKRGRFLYPFIAIMGVSGFGVSAYFHEHFGGTEGLRRALSFYSRAVPVYFVYRYHQIMGSEQHIWDDLDDRTSKMGLDVMLQLKGFYVKCGQSVATNIGNAFPPIWQNHMSILQDKVPAEDYDTVIRPILESELKEKGGLDEIFSYVDPVPIGSASIGQVHRAVLRESGEHVVVKVSYPHIERLLRGDVRTVRAFSELAQPVHVPALIEIEKQFATEFDYIIEADHLENVRCNLERAGLSGKNKLCTLPKPYMQFCTKRMLVMEELHGEKLSDALRFDAERWAAITGKSVDELRSENGRSAIEIAALVAALDAKRKTRNAWVFLRNWTVGWLPGISPHDFMLKSELPLNHAQMMADLLHIHGHEVLVDGRFNADVHPGNILLCRNDDGSPQLGLIDYGQVQLLNKAQRHLFSKLIIALANDDKEEIVSLMMEAGYKSEKMDPENIYLYAKVGYDEDNAALTNGMHIQMFMEELQRRDPIIHPPIEFLMISRTSIYLRGLAHALKQGQSVAKAWKPIAQRVLDESL